MSSYWTRVVLEPDGIAIIVMSLYVLTAVIIGLVREKHNTGKLCFLMRKKREEVRKKGKYRGPFKLDQEGNVIRNFNFWYGLSIFFVCGLCIIVVTIIKIKFHLPKAPYNPMWDFGVGFASWAIGIVIFLWPNIMREF